MTTTMVHENRHRALVDSPVARELAASVNAETVREQQEEIKRLRTENFHLRREGGRTALSAPLTAALVGWLWKERDFLVVCEDGGAPATIGDLMDRADDDSRVLSRLEKAFAAAIHSGVYPRQLCRCRERDCQGCTDDEAQIVLPRRLRNLIAEVRNAR